MTDNPPDDLPIIDVRSPAERFADSGRVGYERLQERFRSSHLDIAAVAWMAFLLGLIALQVYRALRPSSFDFGPTSGWEKASIIATSGSFVFSAGAMIGIALACAYSSTLSRVALGLAVAGGLWAVIANIVGIAVAFHDDSGGSGPLVQLGRGTEDKVVQALGSVMQGGLGLVVFLVALNLLTVPRPSSDAEIAELD